MTARTTLAAPPRPLDARALRNLVALARLLGYLLHFHPSDEVEAADWDAAALDGVLAVEDAASDAELVARLRQLFEPVAPALRVFLAGCEPPRHPAVRLPPGGDAALVRWRHMGFGRGVERERSVYSDGRERLRLKDGWTDAPWTWPEDGEHAAELVPGVECRVPLVVYADAAGTLPRGTAGGGAPAAAGHPVAERTARLAGVILAWNVLQHFYPYFDVVDADWPRELERALESAATAGDAGAYVATLQHMLVPLRDGHAHVAHPLPLDAPLAIAWGWVEDRLVVLEDRRWQRLVRGDVVTHVDGVPVEQAYARIVERMSVATEQHARHRALHGLGSGPPGTRTRLTLRTAAGRERKVSVERSRGRPEPRPPPLAELEPGVRYVDLDRIEPAAFERAIPELARARGIVFDLRGYPRVPSHAVLCHLVDRPIVSPQWHVPVPHRPDRLDMAFVQRSWSVTPRPPRFPARVAFLTDGRAVSAAETFLGLVEHHRVAPIVGEPTAGTNGNVNCFALPGGYVICFTGMKVLKQDGSRHHGVGILPSVPCARTLDGVRAGRDEPLERALELVR